ncbi:MAG: hypothetical protein AB8E15_01155 [Bdellovibrionales bacterium]
MFRVLVLIAAIAISAKTMAESGPYTYLESNPIADSIIGNKGGDWPLPIKPAPFPLKDIDGIWDVIGEKNPYIEIKYLHKLGKQHLVQVSMIDKESERKIATSLGRMNSDRLVSTFYMNKSEFNFEIRSFYPPKNSIEAIRKQKLMVLKVYTDRNQKGEFLSLKKLSFEASRTIGKSKKRQLILGITN